MLGLFLCLRPSQVLTALSLPAWSIRNPALEDQAYDRAHRLGQKLDCNIYKLTIERSVEDRILMVRIFSCRRALERTLTAVTFLVPKPCLSCFPCTASRFQTRNGQGSVIRGNHQKYEARHQRSHVQVFSLLCSTRRCSSHADLFYSTLDLQRCSRWAHRLATSAAMKTTRMALAILRSLYDQVH